MSKPNPEGWPSVQTVSVSDRITISYAEYGTPNGQPVVFFHGTPGSHVLGRLLHDEAMELDVHLLAINRPGYGASDPWPTRTLSTTTEFVAPIMEKAGMTSATMVGFSGGCPHALAVAATRPDLVTAVDAISGTTPPEMMTDTPRVQQALGAVAQTTPPLLQWLFHVQAWIAKYAPPSFIVSLYTNTTDHDEITDEVATIIKHDFIEAFDNYRRGAVTESQLLAEKWDFSLDRIHPSVRLWHGDRDTNIQFEAARRLHDQLPNSELITFNDSDHLLTLLRCRNRVLSRAVADPTGDAQR